MVILVCIGSSCHLKGSHEIVELFQGAIEQYDLKNDVTLGGSFCLGKCGREGVTVKIDDEVFTGVTKEGFSEFFKENVLNVLKKD